MLKVMEGRVIGKVLAFREGLWILSKSKDYEKQTCIRFNNMMV